LKNENKILVREVTPPSVYFNRRNFIRAGVLAAGAVATGVVYRKLNPVGTDTGPTVQTAKIADVQKPAVTATNDASGFTVNEPETSLADITHYNNFYEFGTDKGDPSENATNFRTNPWTLKVEGEVAKPLSFGYDDLSKIAPLEERIYRHRCTERWSIVVPWIGFPLATLLKQADPGPKAKYVAFETYYDPKQMPKGRWSGIQFPYVEGLRLDEAMHPLALLAVGMYGESLPNQDGAPIRLVVPWKYGYKSIKSLVKIRLVEKQPPTTWNLAAPNEYGFYSNVNPHVDHPRWSQAKERRLGELFNRDTLMFNGYSEVASLYAGMDLRKYY
jgi:methionine sulfoxide reductase catalytic subunit